MAYTIIGDNDFKRHFIRAIRKQSKKDTYIKCFDNAVIVNEHKNGFGIFDHNFHFIQESLQTRRNKSQFVPKHFNRDNIPYIDKDVIFER